MNVCVHAAASLTKKNCVGSSRAVAREDPEIWRFSWDMPFLEHGKIIESLENHRKLWGNIGKSSN
jgi:hypothetical protein